MSRPRFHSPFRRSMSIRLRLTLWYSTLLAIVLTVFSVLLYGAISLRL